MCITSVTCCQSHGKGQSVQFSCSVMSDSLWPHGLQHPRFPSPLPTPGAYSNSCPSSQGCHLTISSSVVPFSFCLQSFPASKSFPISKFFASGGQSIRASGSALWVRLCPLKRYVEILSLRSPVEDEPLLKAKQKAHIPCLPSLPQTQQPCSSFFRIPWGLFLC